MTRNREAILRLFRISHNRAAADEPLDAIFPGYQAPVVRKAADGERELVALNWGFVLLLKDKAPKRVTNIRDDKAQSEPLFFQRLRGCHLPSASRVAGTAAVITPKGRHLLAGDKKPPFGFLE